MRARTAITYLVLLSLLSGLSILTPPASTAVQAADPPQPERQGAWLDAMLFTVRDPNQAVAQLQAGTLDVYAHALGFPTPLFQTILEDTDLTYTTSRGSYTEITANPVPVFNDGRINPFGVAEFREAVNMLIDRDCLVQVEPPHPPFYPFPSIRSLGFPRFTALHSAFPDYARHADVIHDIEAMYAYNPGHAGQIIADVMVGMGATMEGGKWMYNGAPVTLTGIIRVEDERKVYGEYVGSQLESAGFTVDRQYKTSSEAYPI